MTSSAPQRTVSFQHNDKLNTLIDELKTLLLPVQNKLQHEDPRFPIGSIVGNPRSGTTVFLQWMASLGSFAYPTNLLNRFAYAPYIGALIQRMMFDPDYDYHADFGDIQSSINYESDLGKSKGALACNEFQHFFRNHMPNFDLEWLDESALDKVDCTSITKGLASIQQAFNKPFVTKGSILQLNIPFFAERIPGLFWIHVQRDPLFVMQSILRAREAYYGNRETWWSSKPREYEQLKTMDIHHQIAGQVYFTEKAMKDGIKAVPEERKLTVQYETFCEEPKAVYDQIRHRYAILGCELPSAYDASDAFACSNKIRLPKEDIDALQEAFREFEDISPVG